MSAASSLGVGLYSLSEAARLLKTPRRTLARWVEGYVGQLRDGVKDYAPVLADSEREALTFGDLVELMFVRGFRGAGVGLDEIRGAAAKYRSEWNTPYPLATKRFATDGRLLVIHEGETWRQVATGQFVALFDELGKQLVHTGDLTTEWRPLGVNRAVVLSPDRAFGKPIDDVSGAHTYVLSRAFEAGTSADQIAWWYGTTSEAVLDAAEFERQFMPGQKRAVAA